MTGTREEIKGADHRQRQGGCRKGGKITAKEGSGKASLYLTTIRVLAKGGGSLGKRTTDNRSQRRRGKKEDGRVDPGPVIAREETLSIFPGLGLQPHTNQ